MSIQKNFYNLLMSGNEAAWTGTSWVMEYSRVFEYTNTQIKQQFEMLDDPALGRLLDLPTLFAYEKFVDAPAHVGRITGISRRQSEFAFTFSFDANVAPSQTRASFSCWLNSISTRSGKSIAVTGL
ncbi:hypothetical protein PEC18_01155 [Paucibacter sp. O1-1]|nr:hypothetical protein [Paucibacter sp. O1-1]MCU7369516.1 hypothetical protein [Paucibacter sp. O1-1]MDA3824477.1 hypothetical protein [Paucibacter sp. O1-1]MDA3824500.1 hypothetical protein [Paucibacter sp. O1-1]